MSDRGLRGYRETPLNVPCPRCKGTLTVARHHDTDLIECTNCLGIFLGRDLVLDLSGPLGTSLRIAFPKRAAPDLLGRVSYIPCITCGTMMNRTVFAKISGVIVDVCKDHGVWFDAGEIASVIAFIEAGGLKIAEERRARDRAEEKVRLERQFRRLREQSAAALASSTSFASRDSAIPEDLRRLFE